MTRAKVLMQTCWEIEDALCLQNIATKPSLDGDVYRGKHVFDALHTPPPMRRHDDVRAFAAGGDQAPPAGQDELLAAIDRGVGRTKTLLFVGGATGAGKSHMVRWAHAQYAEANKEAICIHVEREDTDLPTVVMRLSEAFGQESQLAAIAREAKRVEPGDANQALDGRIVHALSTYASAVVRESKEYMGRLLTPENKELLRKAGRPVPPDPTPPVHIDYVRTQEELEQVQAWAEFVRTGPAERALAGPDGLLQKFRETDPDRRIIVGEDLAPLAKVSDDELAPALRPLRDLLSQPAKRDWIADLLLGPRALDFAVDDVGVGIRAEALRTALRDALKEVAHERVVFFFEDWGTVTGVRRGLLEAFLTMEDRFTAVIADTSDEIRKIQDNVADRTIAVFDLEPLPPASANEMAGRALNTVRVGGVELLSTSKADDESIPNACMSCPYQDPCHRAFGSVDVPGLGPVGFYPLTAPVISRAMADRGTPRTPRTLVMNVVRPAVELREDIFASGSYPTPDVLQRLSKATIPLDAAQREAAKRIVPSDSDPEAALGVLELYRLEGALRSLPEPLAEAFGLVDFARDESNLEGDFGQADESSTPPPPGKIEIPDVAREAERFAQDQALTHPTKLRDRAADLILSGVEFGNGVGPQKVMINHGLIARHDVKLAGSKSGAGVIRIAREDGDALRALVWASATDPVGDFRQQDSAHSRRARALNALVSWRREVDEHVRDPRRRRATARALITHLVALNSALDPGAPEPDSPSAVLECALRQSRPPLHIEERNLRRAYEGRTDARMRLLAEAAFVQGETGDPAALDIPLLAPVLQELLQTTEWPLAETGVPEELRDWAVAVRGALEALREEVASADFEVPERLIADEDVEPLIASTKSLRRAAADAAVAESTIRAIDSALNALEVARKSPPIPATDQVSNRLLQLSSSVELRRKFDVAVEPRLAARKLVEEMIGTTRSAGSQTIDYSRLEGCLDQIAELTGVEFPTLSGAIGATEDGGHDRGAGGLIEQVQQLANEYLGVARLHEDARRLEEAEEAASRVLGALQTSVAVRARAEKLGLSRRAMLAMPSLQGGEVVAYLRSLELAKWMGTVEEQTREIEFDLRSWWQDQLREVEPKDMWELARQLGDGDAEEAFHTATELFGSAKALAQVPLDAEARLAAIRRAEEEAWELLRRQEGPVLDLAMRAHSAAGGLTVTNDILELLEEIDFDRAPVNFVLRIED